MKPRLLVVELHHLGDAVMSLPFVRGAQDKFDVHVLCRPHAAPVYRLLPRVPHTHEWEPPWADERECGAISSIRAASSKGRDLAKHGFDAAVCAWADARAELIMAAAGVTRRIGFPMTRGNYYAADLPWRSRNLLSGRLLEKLVTVVGPARPLLTTGLHRENSRQHHLHCWEQIGKAAGIACDYAVPWIAVENSAEALPLRNTTVSGRKKLVAVHAHARLPSKQWPANKWRALCSLAPVRESFDLCEIVPAGREPLIPDIPAVATTDTTKLCVTLVEADALVCHDSFPAHLAAALGRPVVTIFGSGEPDWFAPWNNRDRAVQRRVCPLHPCIDRCGMDSYLCLDAIGVDDVATEVMKLSTAP
ncbi:MAG: hypothetical protein RIQ71_1791 [Verrucomicrobiota bacterium]|jgi:ADP-heptose:LPS heptosyltransferase